MYSNHSKCSKEINHNHKGDFLENNQGLHKKIKIYLETQLIKRFPTNLIQKYLEHLIFLKGCLGGLKGINNSNINLKKTINSKAQRDKIDASIVIENLLTKIYSNPVSFVKNPPVMLLMVSATNINYLVLKLPFNLNFWISWVIYMICIIFFNSIGA